MMGRSVTLSADPSWPVASMRTHLVIGHVATRWGLDHFIGGVRLEDLVDQDFAWQEGWEYRIN